MNHTPTSPSSSNDRPGQPLEQHGPPCGTFLGHPKGLFLLFAVEMWERFSYYGMRGLLVLYLTAAIAAHQMAPSTYTNNLKIEQSFVQTPEEEEKKIEPPVTATMVPMAVVVGDKSAETTGKLVTGDLGPLKIERLKKVADPKNAGAFIWEPSGEWGVLAPTFSAKAGERPEGDVIKYRVTNPTDKEVKLFLKVQRPFADDVTAEMVKKAKDDAVAAAAKDGKQPDLVKAEETARETDNPEYKVYFRVNDSSGVVSTRIKPDAKLDADAKPYELTFDINRVDSGRSWPKSEANTLYGWYTGMAYLLPILGGLIADKLLGTHRSMVVGGLLIASGHIVLGISGIGGMALSDMGMTVFVFGLALITIGTGHFKPSVSVMVGQLYPLGDPRRESAFSIFYMGINLGSFLCNLACGWLAVTYGWHYGFAAAAVGMLLGLGTYLALRPKLLAGIGEPVADGGGKAPLFLPVGVLCAAGIAALYHVGILRVFDTMVSQPVVVGAIAVAAVGYAGWLIFTQQKGDRGPVATIFIYMLFNALFWLSFEQAGSSLNTFTEEQTNRHIGAGQVPAPYFQSLNPLLIIIFAPIFGMFWAYLARRKKSIGQPYKIGTGLIFVGLGYVVMAFAAMKLSGGANKVSMIYICGCYFLHTVGEIILSPTGLSYVAKTAPRKSMSSLMGIWFISSFIAGLAAGKVGALVDPIIEGKVKLPWASWHKSFEGQASFYLLFVVTSIAAGVLILVIAPLLTRLQRNRQD